MSQLTQPFSSRDTILALITPPLAPAPPPPAGAERLVAKRGAYGGIPFYAPSATLGLQCRYNLALDFGTRCDGLQWSYSPFEQPPSGHVADDPVGLVVG